MIEDHQTATAPPSLDATIALPYTLTTGPAAGSFIAALAEQQILGSRCADCSRVLVPAQDFCGSCGGVAHESLVAMARTGTLTAFTETVDGLIALVRIDGASTDIAHRIVGSDYESLAPGQRVVARWTASPAGTVLDLEGFAIAEGDEASPGEAPRPCDAPLEPGPHHDYQLELRYRHASGAYYGRFFDELGAYRRILGSKCPRCHNVLVPPRPRCEVCYVETTEWVDVADTGRILSFCVGHLEYVGQVREPPFVYAEIMLDGSSTRLIHNVGGIDAAQASTILQPGMPVRAVWRDGDPSGSLQDIEYFEPVGE